MFSDAGTKTSSRYLVLRKDVLEKIRPIIQVRNLVKKYGDITAVKGISFEVSRGEIFGILGPNGAGKTTTLEIIETILPKTSGEVIIDGLDIDLYSTQIKKIIGIQLQSPDFLPNLNLQELISLFSDIFNTQVNIKKLLKKVNLWNKAKSTVNELSSGQKQRFSVALALVGEPQIVFLDEPTTGLDPQARHNLWDLILELKSQGKTIVMTTHYMDEAETLCDQIAIMDAGKILEINTAQGFIEKLLAKGFTRAQPKFGATLEDVFLDMTGKKLRD
jgi:ABC-2 type transport system ATP-binding protein